MNLDDINREPESSNIGKYIRALIAFLTLVVFVSTLFRYYRTETTVRIVKIRDHIDKSQIQQVDISIISSDSSNPRDEDETFMDVELPFNIPVEGGKCTLIGIKADGYHPWERLFCPSVNERIDIEIELIPGDFLPVPQNKFEA